MRIQHVAQCVKGWLDTTPEDRQTGADFADSVEDIHWRLWHGQVRRALDLIGETLLRLNVVAGMTSTTARAASTVMPALLALETYSAGLADLIIDYATARRCEGPFSTSPTEVAVQWLLQRRMAAQQWMRWSPRGAHSMLKVRTSIVNGTFDRHIRSRSCSRSAMDAPSVSESSVTTAQVVDGLTTPRDRLKPLGANKARKLVDGI
jgi:hypothetical protein